MPVLHPFKPIPIFEELVANNDDAIKDYKELIKDLQLKDILKLVQKDTSPMTTDYFAEDDKWDYKMIKWEQFCFKYVGDTIRKFLSLNNYTDCGFAEIWTQISNGFQMHHPHTHGDVGYSFVWYIDVDEDEHEGTYFYAPYGSSPEDFQIKLQKGKFVIWPSWLLHYQPPSNSSLDRCVISGNIKIQQ